MTFNTIRTQNVTCPYCGYEDKDSWEIEFGVNEQGNVTHHFLRIHFAGSERFDYMLRAGV